MTANNQTKVNLLACCSSADFHLSSESFQGRLSTNQMPASGPQPNSRMSNLTTQIQIIQAGATTGKCTDDSFTITSATSQAGITSHVGHKCLGHKPTWPRHITTSTTTNYKHSNSKVPKTLKHLVHES